MNFTDFVDNIKTVNDLFDFMRDYLYYSDIPLEEYRLQSPDDTLEARSGICFDFVELERAWFEAHGYEVRTYFEMVALDYENDYPTHSFLIYKDAGVWYWFEVADYNNLGVYGCIDPDSLLGYQVDKYIDFLYDYGIDEYELDHLVQVEFDKPRFGSTFDEYVDHALSTL